MSPSSSFVKTMFPFSIIVVPLKILLSPETSRSAEPVFLRVLFAVPLILPAIASSSARFIDSSVLSASDTIEFTNLSLSEAFVKSNFPPLMLSAE